MQSSNRYRLFLLSAAAPTLFLAGCAASKALERADDARSPAQQQSASAPLAVEEGFAKPPSDELAAPEPERREVAPDTATSSAPSPGTFAEKPATQGGNSYQAPAKSAADEASSNRAPARSPSAAQPEYRAENRARGAGAYQSSPSVAPPPRETRPGLGTSWGETRTSRVSQVNFERSSQNNPFAVFQINYNDREGILAQTGESNFTNFQHNYLESPGRFVSVEIVDASGSPLQGLNRGDRTYVLGQDRDHYAIRVRNHDRQRFEVVATVDGLDVIDGSKASFGKRGYVLDSYGTILIEGFRRSSNAIAAFRFGSVADSYAAKTSGDRNVGVIGVAIFSERNRYPVYTDGEIERRETADPFPGQYARPPRPRGGYDLE